MEVTELGISIELKTAHSSNVDSPMEVTELGMVIVVNPDSAKAQSPMEVTELGISIETRLVQPPNASIPMEVTELGMMVVLQPLIRVFVAVSMMALQLSRESYTVFPSSTVMVSKLVQPSKGLIPIDVTELGMVIEVKPDHPKAQSPMEVTELGISIELKTAHSSNVDSPMEVTELGMVIEVKLVPLNA